VFPFCVVRVFPFCVVRVCPFCVVRPCWWWDQVEGYG
jgi:hypothetical protein